MYGMPNLSLGNSQKVWGADTQYLFQFVDLGQSRPDSKSEDIERTADVFEFYEGPEAEE